MAPASCMKRGEGYVCSPGLMWTVTTTCVITWEKWGVMGLQWMWDGEYSPCSSKTQWRTMKVHHRFVLSSHIIVPLWSYASVRWVGKNMGQGILTMVSGGGGECSPPLSVRGCWPSFMSHGGWWLWFIFVCLQLSVWHHIDSLLLLSARWVGRNVGLVYILLCQKWTMMNIICCHLVGMSLSAMWHLNSELDI